MIVGDTEIEKVELFVRFFFLEHTYSEVWLQLNFKVSLMDSIRSTKSGSLFNWSKRVLMSLASEPVRDCRSDTVKRFVPSFS